MTARSAAARVATIAALVVVTPSVGTASQGRAVAAGRTASGVVVITARGHAAMVGFVVQVTTPGHVRLRLLRCATAERCEWVRQDGPGELSTAGDDVVLRVVSTPFGALSLRATRGRADVGYGSCELGWSDADDPGQVRKVAFERFGSSVRAPWTGWLGAGRATTLPGGACSWYLDAGAVALRG